MTFTQTPIEVMPLHPLSPEHVYACEVPEMPPGRGQLHDGRCRACWLAAKAAVLGGYNPMRGVQRGDGYDIVSFAEFVERNAPFHGFAS